MGFKTSVCNKPVRYLNKTCHDTVKKYRDFVWGFFEFYCTNKNDSTCTNNRTVILSRMHVFNFYNKNIPTKIYDFNLCLTKLYACILKCNSSEWPSMPYASLCVCVYVVAI
jgi:hypothetical protein